MCDYRPFLKNQVSGLRISLTKKTAHIPILVIDIDPIREEQILLHPSLMVS